MNQELQTGSEPSLTTLVTGIINDAQELMKQQLALFRHEFHDDLRKTREVALSWALALGIAFCGGIMLSLMLVHLLFWAVPAVPLWGWFGIVGAVLVGGGVVLFLVGKKELDSFNPLPDQSVNALKENVQWLMRPK